MPIIATNIEIRNEGAAPRMEISQSEAHPGQYYQTMIWCGCAAFKYRGGTCKHLKALVYKGRS